VNVKKIVTLVVVALVLFFLIAQPHQAANGVSNILGWLKSAADALITFVQSVFS
jgi:cell shape-determining protein MreC